MQVLIYQGFDHRPSEASSFLWVEWSLVVLMYPGVRQILVCPRNTDLYRGGSVPLWSGVNVAPVAGNAVVDRYT